MSSSGHTFPKVWCSLLEISHSDKILLRPTQRYAMKIVMACLTFCLFIHLDLICKFCCFNVGYYFIWYATLLMYYFIHAASWAWKTHLASENTLRSPYALASGMFKCDLQPSLIVQQICCFQIVNLETSDIYRKRSHRDKYAVDAIIVIAWRLYFSVVGTRMCYTKVHIAHTRHVPL